LWQSNAKKKCKEQKCYELEIPEIAQTLDYREKLHVEHGLTGSSFESTERLLFMDDGPCSAPAGRRRPE
jgi:hypothetical protein